jgi:hypothetical protein
LEHYIGLFGSDEVLTDRDPGDKVWRGTFINTADSQVELEAKRQEMLKEIGQLQGEDLVYIDTTPY